MTDLARLVTVLEAQTAKYSADLDKANRKLDAFGRSANGTLKRFDQAAKRAAQGLKAFGVSAVVFQGVSAAIRGAEGAIKNLAAVDAQFAASIKKTKAAYENLWQAGSQAAAAQERLNAALQNPELLGAARRGADNLAAGYLNTKTRALEALAAAQKLDRWMGERLGLYDPADAAKQDYGGLVASKMPAAREAQRAKDASKGPNPYMDLVTAAGARDAKEQADAVVDGLEVQITAMRKFDRFNAFRGGEPLAIDPQQFVDTRFDQFAESIERDIAGMVDKAQHSFGQISVYADEAARNMQTAFADFLFDPFENGVKGMLKNFVDVIRRMVAEAAAAKIFGSKKSGGLGLGDLVTGAVDSLFGFAHGGSFNVGGSGGTDSQLVAFKATPGERVIVQTPAQQGRGGGIVINQNVAVDAHGATIDAIRAIPAAMAEAKRQAVAEVQELVRRGRL